MKQNLICAVALMIALGLPVTTQAAPPAISEALDKTDSRTAARLAIEAMRSGDATAEPLLLEAVMAGRPILTQTAQKTFPKYLPRIDVIPPHAVMASDASKVMVMHNEAGDATDIYEVATGRLLRRFTTAPFFHGWSADLSTLALATKDAFWLEDTASGERLFSLPDIQYNYGVRIANDRRWMTVFLGDDLRLYDLSATPPSYKILSGRHAADGALLSPDGRIMIADVADAPVLDAIREVWDVANKTVRIVLKSNGATRDVFTQDSRYLVTSRIASKAKDGSGWDWKVQIWDMTSFAPIGAPLIMKDVDHAQTLPGGHLIALTTWHRVQILDLRTHRFVGAGKDISFFWAPGWTRDGLVTIDYEHEMRSYALDPALGLGGDALIAEACRRLSEGC